MSGKPLLWIKREGNAETVTIENSPRGEPNVNLKPVLSPGRFTTIPAATLPKPIEPTTPPPEPVEEKKELPKKLKKSNEIFDELIDTERQFLVNLRVIVEVFYRPLQESGMLNKIQLSNIFSNVESLYTQVNLPLMEQLERLVEADGHPEEHDRALWRLESIGEIFCELSPLFKLYAVYCSNQPNIHARLVQFRQDLAPFAKFLKDALRNPECRKLDIESFLITPLQRLCKYPLLFRELLTCTEEGDAAHSKLQSAMSSIGEIVTQVNERVRKAENLNKLISVSKDITFVPSMRFDILSDHNRVFHLENEFLFNGTDAYGYLFHDLMLVSRQMKTGEFSVNQIIWLRGCVVLDEVALSELPNRETRAPPPEGYPFILEMQQPTVEAPHLIAFSNKFRMKTWAKTLRKAVETAPPPPEGAVSSPALETRKRGSSIRSPFSRGNGGSVREKKRRSESGGSLRIKKRSAASIFGENTGSPKKEPAEGDSLRQSKDKYRTKYKEEKRRRVEAENALATHKKRTQSPMTSPLRPEAAGSAAEQIERLTRQLAALEEENARLTRLCAQHKISLD